MKQTDDDLRPSSLTSKHPTDISTTPRPFSSSSRNPHAESPTTGSVAGTPSSRRASAPFVVSPFKSPFLSSSPQAESICKCPSFCCCCFIASCLSSMQFQVRAVVVLLVTTHPPYRPIDLALSTVDRLDERLNSHQVLINTNRAQPIATRQQETLLPVPA